MSKSTNACRRGLAVIATTALVAGATFAGAGTATAASGDYKASGKPNVTQGQNNQAAGDLSYEFNNAFVTNTTLSFTVKRPGNLANQCDTSANIAKTIEFAAVPTVAVTTTNTDADANAATIPTYTVTLDSADAQCQSAGILDRVSVKFTSPSAGDADDTLTVTIGGVKYNVGADAPTGDVPVVEASSPATLVAANPNPVFNAKIVNKSFVFVPLKAALPDTDGNALGTATYTESTAGAYFPAGATTPVELVLGGGSVFTNGVVPTITVPAGYTATKPAANGTDTYTFSVTAPATAQRAIVTVSGLQADTDNSVGTDTITSSVGSTVDTMDALNVLRYNERIGGTDRYATAAQLFDEEFGCCEAILVSGQNFPDALSANYLAGQEGVGTLLTKSETLSPAAREAINSNNIERVYIVGGPGAVSQAVEDAVESITINDGCFFCGTQHPEVVRVAGADRYATNSEVNLRDISGSTPTVLMAFGGNFPDALSLGPIAYNEGMPLILTKGDTLGAGEKNQLDNLDPQNVVIAGGTGVVSSAVENELKSMGYNVLRLAGVNRTLTAAAVATWATQGVDGPDSNSDVDTTGFASTLGFSTSQVNVANGANFPDALAAGPNAGEQNQVILLSSTPTLVGAGLEDFLSKIEIGTTSSTVEFLRALGLTGATSRSMMKDAAVFVGTAQ